MEENKNKASMEAYWQENVKIIIGLLSVWALVSFVAVIFLAYPLLNVYVAQLPLSFWFGHQGAMVTFVVLIFVYVKLMDNLDEKYDVHEVKR